MDVHKYIAKFTGKTAGSFLLTLAAALALWLYIAANIRKDAVADLRAGLITINNFKNSEIRDWRLSRISEAQRLSEHPFLGQIVSEEISKPGSRREQLKTWIKGHIAHKMYSDMAFLSTKGTVIAASPGYRAATEKHFIDAFARSYREGAALLTDIHLSAEGRPCFEMISPISAEGRGGKPVCLLVIHIDPEREFYPLVKAAPLLYEKAETLLVREDGKDVLFMNELDYRGGSALNFRRPLTQTDLPSAAALRGHNGFFAGLDYRGAKVFSAVSHIEDSGWAVVTKIDRDEILAPVKTRERLQLALLLTVACLLYILVYYMLRSRRLTAQRSLAESETKYRALVDASGDGILTADLESMKFNFANQAICRMLGYTAKELTALSVTDIHPKNALPSVIAEFKAQARGEKTLAPDLPCLRKDGTIFYADITTTPVTIDGRKYNLGIFRDITEIKRMELVNLARLRLIQYSDTHTLDELLEEALNEAEKLTGSLIGFYHFVEADQKTLSLQNWSTRTKGEYCKAEGKDSHYGIDKAGVWANCLRERKPVIHNDYASLPDKKGLPPGHAPLAREIVVPVMREGKVVSIMGVGNKPGDYNEKDVQILSLLADLSWEVVNRKLAENKLREGQRVFSEFMEHSPIYVFFKDKDLKALHLSRNYEKMLGRPMQELLGKSMDDLFPSDLAKKMIEDDKRIIAEGKEIVVEEELNGRFYRTIKFPIKLEGKPPYLAGYTIDITEQRRFDDTLRESEERLRVTLQETNIGTWDWDITNDIWQASSTYSTMLGYPPEPGHSDRKVWLPRVHPDDRDMVAEKISGVLNGNVNKYQYEARIKHADGTYRWVAVVGTTVKQDKNGKPARIMGVRMDITERKLAEQALRKSEESYRETVELAVDGFLLGSPDGKIIGANSQMQKLAGRTLAELLGMHVGALFSPGTLEAAPLRFDLLNEGQTVINERSLLRPDGTTLPVEMRSKRMPDGTYQSIYRDITASKLAEKERLAHLHFLESLDRVNRAIQGAEDLETMMKDVLTAVLSIFDCDRAWLFYPCDPDAPSFQVPMEITRPEYPGAGILNMDIPLPPDMAHNLRELLGSAEPVTYMAGTERPINKTTAEQFGVKSQMMTALYPKSGKPWVFGIHQCSYPRVWAPEQMRLLQEIGRRTTDSLTSLLSRSELQESEHSLKEAHRLARLGNWKLDLVSNRLTWSDELYRIFELDPGKFEASYEAFLEAIHPDDRAYVDKAYTDSVKNRCNYNIVHRLLMKDGRIKYINERCETSYAPDGRPLASQGTSLDITEMKQAELELQRLNRDLAARKQEMENFLYITTHDLRSPLVNIQGFTQNLVRYLQELRDRLAPAGPSRPADDEVAKLAGERIPEALKYVLESSRKMDALISSLLKVARLGRVEMKPEVLDMNVLVKKITDSLHFQSEKAGVSIKTGVLPPCKADQAAVSQILSNLLGNAIKYRDRDRALEISVTGEVKGARVTYTVADNGAGIAAKDLPKIWDLFYRAGSAGMEGEGIGLTVVKYMAEKNGGSVKVESREGQGSAFRLELPAAGGMK